MAFLRFWFEQVNVAYTKPDATIIPALSTAECKSCANLAEEPIEYEAKGYRMAPAPGLPLADMQSLGTSPDGKTRISFTLSQRSVQVVDPAGKVIESQKGNTVKRVALLAWEGDKWLMDGLAAPAS